jgi:hypothetical protein
VVVVFLLAVSRTAFAVIALPLELAPETVLSTHTDEVGLVVDVPPAIVPTVVRLLSHHQASASFATSRLLDPRLNRLLAIHHDQTISMLSRPGIDDWLGTMDAVRRYKAEGSYSHPRAASAQASTCLPSSPALA